MPANDASVTGRVRGGVGCRGRGPPPQRAPRYPLLLLLYNTFFRIEHRGLVARRGRARLLALLLAGTFFSENRESAVVLASLGSDSAGEGWAELPTGEARVVSLRRRPDAVAVTRHAGAAPSGG